ncbi:hypothetical protein [Vibrio parahaemolyticus]|uniref:hypothetical protein n=1 Tax=Vibrio parahaemolyticus TaxID=670 RepID=UPI00111ED2FB|nr:hypothetical protein [Vibrio parahaemolyticus]MCQ9100224.1 hypothetical protein [Vibrio parahaemolyticus]MDL2009815.1 hypothetical protein [Vibrio parahaemolyticus]TON78799.1 hypothetical protein CGH49_24305 [Vibrio parahaemolyticus]HCG6696646.1 hypothetical protein [Vibrio parahaemolyticus]
MLILRHICKIEREDGSFSDVDYDATVKLNIYIDNQLASQDSLTGDEWKTLAEFLDSRQLKLRKSRNNYCIDYVGAPQNLL